MTETEIVPTEAIASSIILLRGQNVIIDTDLALLYGVETKVFNQAVKRNKARFPVDLMFQVNKEERVNWSQIVTGSIDSSIRRRCHMPLPNTAL